MMLGCALGDVVVSEVVTDLASHRYLHSMGLSQTLKLRQIAKLVSSVVTGTESCLRSVTWAPDSSMVLLGSFTDHEHHHTEVTITFQPDCAKVLAALLLGSCASCPLTVRSAKYAHFAGAVYCGIPAGSSNAR